MHQHIRRVTRERDTAPNVRIEGEKTCWLIFDTFVQRLQSLGYVTTVPQQLRAEMKHQIEAVPGFVEIKNELTRVDAPEYVAHAVAIEIQVPRELEGITEVAIEQVGIIGVDLLIDIASKVIIISPFSVREAFGVEGDNRSRSPD